MATSPGEGSSSDSVLQEFVCDVIYFPRMTDRSRKVIDLSKKEAIRLGSSLVEPQHLLLGLAKEKTGVAGNVLYNLGADYKQLMEAYLTIVPTVVDRPKSIALSDATNQLLAAAHEETLALGHNYIGTEHLMLAVVRCARSRIDGS